MVPEGNNARILLVDDTRENLQVAGELLRSKGYLFKAAHEKLNFKARET